MKSRKWKIIAIAELVLLLIIGIMELVPHIPVKRTLSEREAAAYDRYDIQLPAGETNAYTYLLSKCRLIETETPESGVDHYWPGPEMSEALYACRHIDSVYAYKTEVGGQELSYLDIWYDTIEETEVYLSFTENGTLIFRSVYDPLTDTVVMYEINTGKTTLEKPFRRHH